MKTIQALRNITGFVPFSARLSGRSLFAALIMSAASPALGAVDATWHTIDGGGGVSRSADGRFSVSGTAGQPDAGVKADNASRFALVGGFWYAETVFCGCTLTVASSGGNIIVSWPFDLSGCVLEYAEAMSENAVWQAVSPQPTGRSYTTPATGAQRYFRLRSP
jgi:hypothetical protein